MKIVKLTALIPTVFVSLIVIGLFLWVIEPHEPVSNAEPAKTATVIDKYREGPPERQELLELVNKERTRVGVKPLKLHTALNKSAQYKADDMVRYDYYAHKDTAGKEGYTYVFEYAPELCSYASENIAADLLTSWDAMYGQDPTGWWTSQVHKDAALDPRYTYTGFGVSQERDGDYYAVQHFCDLK